MVSAPKPKRTRMSCSHEELKDNIVVEAVAKDGDDVEKKMKNKKKKKNKNKKESNLRSNESKNLQPSPKHTTQTSNSHASPTTINYRSPELIVPQTSLYKGMKCSTYCEKRSRRLKRKDQCLHKLVFQENVLEDGAAVGYFVYEEKQLQGEINIKQSGILCDCCKEVVSPSKFEAHAGWASRRKPYFHIRTTDGVSLHQLAINHRISISNSDEHCSKCKQRGNLLCCDGCQRAFHLGCIPVESPPKEKWYCEYCRNKLQKDKNVEHKENVVTTQKIIESDPSEQIAKICTLSVKHKEVEHSSCALCSERHFNNGEFSPWTVMICDQCEKDYHVGCLKDHNMANLKKVPKHYWFCGVDCYDIHMKLKNFMARGDVLLSDSLLSLIKNKKEQKGLETEFGLDIKWKVFNRQLIVSKIITSSLLSDVVTIFHEQFDSIVVTGTKIDLIPAMVKGRKIKDKYYFGGMYCAVLIVNQVVVSAGIFRVFGKEVAELSLIATKAEYQKQGFFKCLLSCIENVLKELKVERLVLPAAHEAESMWIDKFGFTEPNQGLINNFRKFYHNLMIFEGTSLLQKKLVLPSQ
ncbi:increased DNA methylation 1 [Medicago truncatula]|uniref:increased DNA methylation 1 n=1 Tax=Medicago truncatula TaxID=3880 RepID=UPI001967DD36|nr:increased DNA methylation 1-like [Medicago truncatula]